MKSAILAAWLMVAMYATANAGTTGALQGVVVDEAGRAVTNVSVTATSSATVCRTTTDARGAFTCLSLSPDVYTVTVEKQGRVPLSIAGISVSSDHEQALKIRMPLQRMFVIRDCLGACGTGSRFVLPASGVTVDVYDVNQYTYPGFSNTIRITDALKIVPGVVVVP